MSEEFMSDDADLESGGGIETNEAKNTLNIDFLNKLCAVGPKGICYEDICEAFDVNKRTAQRWISTVERLFTSHLMVRRTSRNKYFWLDFSTNKNYSFQLSSGDVTAIKSTVALLERYSESDAVAKSLLDDVRSLEMRVEGSMTTRASMDVYEENTEYDIRHQDNVIKFRGPRYHVNGQMIEVLMELMRRKRLTKIIYNADKSEVNGKEYLIAPIGFLYGNNQYLVAKTIDPALVLDLPRDSNVVSSVELDIKKIRGTTDEVTGDEEDLGYRIFKLTNIRDVLPFVKQDVKRTYRRRGADGSLPEKKKPEVKEREIFFNIGPDETVENIMWYSFGVMRGERVRHYKLRFDKDVSKMLSDYAFVTPRSRQTVNINDSGEATVEFDARGIMEIKWFLEPFGKHVEVIEPYDWKVLVDERACGGDITPLGRINPNR